MRRCLSLRVAGGRHWAGGAVPVIQVIRDFGRWFRWISLVIAANAAFQAAAVAAHWSQQKTNRPE